MFLQLMSASCALCLLSMVLCYRILGDEPERSQVASACPADTGRKMVALEDRHGH
jgi:hypothetical protein